jgi:hypothetical protein
MSVLIYSTFRKRGTIGIISERFSPKNKGGTVLFMTNIDHYIVFPKKRQFFAINSDR